MKLKRTLFCILTLLALAALPASAEAAAPTPMPSPTAVPVWVNGQPVDGYQREEPIDIPAGDEYLTIDYAVTTYRGDSFRTNAAVGTLEEAPAGLELLWDVETGAHNTGLSGFGSASQPAIVKWSQEIRLLSDMTEEAQNTAALREVIFASLDGQVYFLNLADGTPTREAIDVGYPLLSPVTLHPLNYPVMLVGQHDDALRYTIGSIGLHYYETLTQRPIRFIDGEMPGMTDYYLIGRFDTAALIDRRTDTAVALSYDGYLYTETLGSRFFLWGPDSADASVSFEFGGPVIAKLTDGLEKVYSAPVMHGSRIWFGTSDKRIICADTTTMQPVWTTGLPSRITSLAMEQDADGQLWLYAGDSRLRTDDTGVCTLLRIHADTGETDWAFTQPLSEQTARAGAFASPIIGENALDGLVFFAVAGTADDGSSTLLALDGQTGEVFWSQTLPGPAYASPVAVYDEEGNGWIVAVTGDNSTAAALHLLSGPTGQVLHTLPLAGGSPSSPAVYGDTLVIGTSIAGDYDNAALAAADASFQPGSGHIYGVRLTAASATPRCWAEPYNKASDFMRAWAANDRDAMLALCAPSWKAEGSAELRLFRLLANRTAIIWFYPMISGTDANALVLQAQIDKNDGSDPQWYQFTLQLAEEEGQLWIVPDGIASCEAIENPLNALSSLIPFPE